MVDLGCVMYLPRRAKCNAVHGAVTWSDYIVQLTGATCLPASRAGRCCTYEEPLVGRGARTRETPRPD